MLRLHTGVFVVLLFVSPGTRPRTGREAVSSRIIRPEELVDRLGISRTTLWRLQKRGEFPPPLQLSPNAVGWSEAEITEWLESRPRAGSAREENEAA